MAYSKSDSTTCRRFSIAVQPSVCLSSAGARIRNLTKHCASAEKQTLPAQLLRLNVKAEDWTQVETIGREQRWGTLFATALVSLFHDERLGIKTRCDHGERCSHAEAHATAQRRSCVP